MSFLSCAPTHCSRLSEALSITSPLPQHSLRILSPPPFSSLSLYQDLSPLFFFISLPGSFPLSLPFQVLSITLSQDLSLSSLSIFHSFSSHLLSLSLSQVLSIFLSLFHSSSLSSLLLSLSLQYHLPVSSLLSYLFTRLLTPSLTPGCFPLSLSFARLFHSFSISLFPLSLSFLRLFLSPF